VTYSRGGASGDLTITNYEMVEHFDPADFGAVVLDESSILKSLDGKTRRQLTEMFAETPYRLAAPRRRRRTTSPRSATTPSSWA
jgi:hypothetical protein